MKKEILQLTPKYLRLRKGGIYKITAKTHRILLDRASRLPRKRKKQLKKEIDGILGS